MSRTYRRKDLMKKTDMEITEGRTLRGGKVKDERVFHKIHGDQQYVASYDKSDKLFIKATSKKSRKASKKAALKEAVDLGESSSRSRVNHRVKSSTAMSYR